MRKRNTYTFMLTAALSVLGSGLGGFALAQQQPKGSYQQTCRNIVVDRDTRVLMAECRTRDGNWRSTTLVKWWMCTYDIYNDDGQLRCTR